MFRLDFLDRLVYLDADTVVLKNIDDLFSTSGFAAAPDAGIERPSLDTFNSGVFAADPSYELFEDLLRRLPYTPSKDGGDQGFLNNVFPDWHRLPPEYNTTKRVFSHHPELYVHDDIKVLHYVGNKPWEPSEADGRYEEIDRRWVEHLEGWELRELLQALRVQAREALDANRVPEELPLVAPLSGTPFRQAQQLNRARRYGERRAPPASVARESNGSRAARDLQVATPSGPPSGGGRVPLRPLRLAPRSRSTARELAIAHAICSQQRCSGSHQPRPTEPRAARRADGRSTWGLRRQRLLHLDFKTVNSYGDQLLFELVRQTFNSFGGGAYFDVTESHPFRERATAAWVDQANENFDGVVIGGGGIFPRRINATAASGWQWNITTELLAI